MPAETSIAPGICQCPACGGNGLRAVFAVDEDGAPPGSPEHVIVYNRTLLLECPACGILLVEKLCHDCFDFEELFDQYTWHALDAGDSRRLRAALRPCPNPMSFACACPVHASLRARTGPLPRTFWTAIFDRIADHTKRTSLADIIDSRLVPGPAGDDSPEQ